MGQEKECKNCKEEFIVEEDDFNLYGALDLPAPEYCHYCLWKYLLAFWVFGRFRITKSDLSGKTIITVLSENVPFPIYSHDEFISDDWDPLDYGIDYDPNRSFVEQLVELQSKVPHPHSNGTKNVNCDWCDDVWESKNSYLTRSALLVENISYGYRVFRCKDSVDLAYCFDIEHCYDCLYCFKSFKLRHSFNSRDCIDSSFLYDCRNCQNCFMSWNLRNKNYCVRNKQYSREDYFKEMERINFGSYSVIEGLRNEFWEHIKEDAVHRASYNTKVVNSNGNFLDQDKNCYNCCFWENSENCRHCFRGLNNSDNIYVVGTAETEKSAFILTGLEGYENIYSMYSPNCRWGTYLDVCLHCENCFGCVGLRKKKYCILNKQYSKEDYENLVVKIKDKMKKDGEWGKFWPLSSAYCGYNDSLGQIMFPMTKDEAIKFGAKWEEHKTDERSGISSNDLPDDIDDVNDDILNKGIICEETKYIYSIAKHELDFYRQHKIPLPRRHFDLRTLNRFRPMTLMVYPKNGICIFCKNEIIHYYSPKLGFEKIACIECYQKEIL